MDWLGWIEALPPAALLRQNMVAYILVNAGHIIGVGLLVGAILPLDLRLIGLLREGPLVVLAPFLARVAAAGLMLAILTGAWLFSVKPVEYTGNSAFLAKMGLLALGLVNVVLQHRSGGWLVVTQGGAVNLLVRSLAALSLSLWLAVLVAGRWIGFV